MNKEIAGRLKISEQGVKQQVSVLLRKFAVGSRAMLVRSSITMRLLGRTSTAGLLYEYLFDRAPVLIAMSRGPAHEFTLVNPAFVSLFGEREYIGRTLTECFPHADAGLLAQLDGVIERGEPWSHSRQRLPRSLPDGTAREVYLSLVAEPMRDASGGIHGIAFYAWDVTEEVAVRGRLRQLSAEQEVLLHQLPVGVIYTDALARPVLVNPVATRILGGSFDPARPLYAQLADRNIRIASSGAPLSAANAPSAVAITDRPFDEELVARAQSGGDVALHISARPLHDEHGTVTGAVLVVSERGASGAVEQASEPS